MKKILLLISICTISFSGIAQDIQFELLKDGFSRLLGLEHAGDNRLFAVEQDGLIKILNPDNTVNPTPFLDVSNLVGGGGEQGLLGLAFHPEYNTNGYFYINYVNNAGDTQVVRYTVSATNPDVADTSTALPIISYDQPFANHNGGDIKFGPDGFLYIASGDGGSGGDPGNRAQNLNTLLGKLLRIDVDNPTAPNNYGIPADNPFVGVAGARDEIWAYGLRNPWRFSFDSLNGDLWIADVGQNAVEEINKAPGTDAGLNYGWRCYEGSDPFNTTGCPDVSELTFPFAEYDQPLGFSITGGFVYRGAEYPLMQGLYFYADFATSIVGYVEANGNLINLGNQLNGSWSSFSEGPDGTLYIIDFNGGIYKVTEQSLIGFDDNTLNDAIKIYPNPANEKLFIEASNATISQITINDMRGAQLLHIENVNTSNIQLPINTVASGTYIVSITTTFGDTTHKKLIIK